MHLNCLFVIIVFRFIFVDCVISEFSPAGSRLSDELIEDDLIVLEPINGTRDFRINSKKDADDKPWFDGRDFRFIHCVRQAKCEKLQNNTCFGSKLPYASTSLALTDSKTQDDSREKLYNYEALRNVPKCWAVIQPFLCAVFAPKCEKIKGKDMVYLPSLEMCRITSEPCRILYNTSFFPDFLKCTESIFPSKCNNDVREMKFNAMGQCQPPLVQADSSHNYYKDIEGCGVQCKDPLYTNEEHDGVHTVIAYGSLLCFLCNLFVVTTFLIHDWKKAKHPALIIFYINICFLLNWIGWFVQFVSDNRENIVCRRDGTLRHSEPSAGENLSCIIPFILIYYFLMAAMVWFTIFTYAWHLQTTDRGSIRDRIDKKSSYFHLVAWSMPLVLTITIMALSEVDGNSITGICFVGYRNHTIRIAMVLLPIGLMSSISFFFSVRGILQLLGIRRNTSNGDESKKLHAIILRMGIRTILSLLCIVGYFVFQVYEFRNSDSWKESLNDLIICKIKSTYSDVQTSCKLKTRPSVAILQLRLLCVFGTCIVISSWCCTPSTFKTWTRFIRKYELIDDYTFGFFSYFTNCRKMGHEMSDDEKFTKPKHKVIADAYAKRLEGVISVSIQNSNTDPAGLNFDMNNLNSTESNGMGATLTNYLCNIIHRRNAITSLDYRGTAQCAPCASSCDSEISVSVRQFNVSVESRRSSIDSQVSVKMSETEIKAKVESRSQKHKNMNMKSKNRRNCYATSRRSNRRTSSSSVESQLITTQAVRKGKCKGPASKIRLNSNTIGSHFIKNRSTDRRSACTTLDIIDLNHLRNNINLNSLTTSEDENCTKLSSNLNHEPSSVLVPFTGVYDNVANDSSNSIEKYDNGTALSGLENLHPMIQKLFPHGNITMTKPNRNSMRSSKSRQSHKYRNQGTNICDELSSSACSSMDIETGVGNSGNSIGGNKTQSRNSKASCDIGIQANAYDISSHTRFDDLDRKVINEKNERNKGDDDDDDVERSIETHKLLSIASHRDMRGMSETEKLKMLLLP